jgi:hypothetical protein
VEQARANASAGALGPLGAEFDDGVRAIYDSYIRASVEDRW